MPIAVILIGVVLLVLAFRGTEHQFARQLGTDVVQGQFLSWLVGITVVGALGYAKSLRPLSTALLALVVVTLVLTHGGLFAQLQQLVQHPPQPSPPLRLSAYPAAPSSASGAPAAQSSDNSAQQAGQALATAAEVAAVLL